MKELLSEKHRGYSISRRKEWPAVPDVAKELTVVKNRGFGVCQ